MTTDAQMPERIWASGNKNGSWNDTCVDPAVETAFIRADLCASVQVRALAFIEAARFIEEMEQVEPPEPMSADMLKAVAGAGLREMAKRIAALAPASRPAGEAGQEGWRLRDWSDDSWQWEPTPQPVGKAVPVGDGSLQARIGEIGNQVHNIACEHQADEALAERLGTLRGELWRLAQEVAHPPQPSVSIAEAAEVLLGDDIAISRMAEAIHDGPLGADDFEFSAARPQGAWCVDVVRAALRALKEGEA